MTDMRVARISACIAIIAVCAIVMMKGVELLAFARLSERVDGFSAALKSGQVADYDRLATFDRELQAWSQVWGLRAVARTRAAELRLDSVSTLSVELVERDSASVLSIEPLKGHMWMKLANARLLSGKSLESVLAAFDMAALTTPLESNVLYERVEFGFAFWDILSAERRERTAADFVALRKQMHLVGLGGKEVGWLVLIIASKSQSIRADMRNHIERRAGSDTSWFRQFGL